MQTPLFPFVVGPQVFNESFECTRFREKCLFENDINKNKNYLSSFLLSAYTITKVEVYFTQSSETK